MSVGHRGDGRDGGRVCSGSCGEKEARGNQKTNTVGRAMRRLEGEGGEHLQPLRNGAVASLDESAQEVKRG